MADAPYTTFEKYEIYNGKASPAEVQTLITESLIPEATQLINQTIGYKFNVSTLTDINFDAEKDTAHSQLFFETFANEVNTVTLNGNVISVDDYVLIGPDDGPYDGIDLLDSAGLSWHDFGENPQEAIVVNAKWGFSEDVPPLLLKAIYKYIQDSLANRQETNIDPQTKLIDSILRLFVAFRPFA